MISKRYVGKKFGIEDRKINGTLYQLININNVFASKTEATRVLKKKQKSYPEMSYKIVELSGEQQLTNYSNVNKPLKYALFKACKK